MEGSGKRKAVDISDPKFICRNAGLPEKAGAAWMKTFLHFGRDLKRDTAAATKYWREGSSFLSKLAKKSKRTREQQLAADIIQLGCRSARERFLSKHADAIYRKLTKNLDNFLRVDELVTTPPKSGTGADADTQAGRC